MFLFFISCQAASSLILLMYGKPVENMQPLPKCINLFGLFLAHKLLLIKAYHALRFARFGFAFCFFHSFFFIFFLLRFISCGPFWSTLSALFFLVLLLFFLPVCLSACYVLRAADSHSNAPSCSSLVAFAASVCPFCSCFFGFAQGDWLSARLRGLLQRALPRHGTLPLSSRTGLICMRNMSKLLWSIHWLLFMYLARAKRKKYLGPRCGSCTFRAASADIYDHV